MATRRQRENVFRQVIETAAEQPVSKITATTLEKGRDRRAPNQGRHFLDTMRGLFRSRHHARALPLGGKG